MGRGLSKRTEISIDLHFRLPPEAGPAVLRNNRLSDEADEHCRRAELLTGCSHGGGRGRAKVGLWADPMSVPGRSSGDLGLGRADGVEYTRLLTVSAALH